MAKPPEYVSILLDGFGERFDQSVKRTEMERGPVKQEVLNSQVMMETEATLFFRGRADTVHCVNQVMAPDDQTQQVRSMAGRVLAG